MHARPLPSPHKQQGGRREGEREGGRVSGRGRRRRRGGVGGASVLRRIRQDGRSSAVTGHHHHHHSLKAGRPHQPQPPCRQGSVGSSDAVPLASVPHVPFVNYLFFQAIFFLLQKLLHVLCCSCLYCMLDSTWFSWRSVSFLSR